MSAGSFRTSTHDPAVTYTWSDASVFNGYLLIGYILPGSRSTINIGNQFTPIVQPVFYRFKINDGAVDQSVSVIYTSDLTPTNVKYVAWLYDETGTQVLGPSSLFFVTAATFSPTFSPTTPTATAAGSTAPTPD